MLTELKSIFESVDKEILSEDTLTAISSLIEEKVNTKVQERVNLEVESAVKSQYEKFKVVSEKAVAAIDADHTNKIKMVVNAIMEDYDNKLLTVHKGYKSIIAETAIKHRDSLVESVDEFLDLYIEKNLPKQQIEEAAKNKYALKAIEEARKILGVDEKYINNNIKEAVVEGKQQLDTLLKENQELKRAKMIAESKKILAEKTSNLPVEVSRFVRSRLEGKTAEFIKENFDYVIDMYGRQEQKAKKAALLNENKQFNVDRNRVADEIIKESENKTQKQTNPNNPMEDLYMSGLNFRK
jgi:hypothetical protein